MGKESGKVVIGAITTICLLLMYNVFFPSEVEQWKTKLSDWRGSSQDNKANQETRDQEPMEYHLRRLVRGEDRVQLDTTGFACHSELHTIICIASQPVRMDNKDLTIYISGPQAGVQQTIKPYPLQDDQTAMERVSPIQLVHANTSNLPRCHFTHDIPAVIFSSGGFTGNIFHEINEIIIPLFLTSRHFQTRLQFVITDYKAWWVSKYSKVLSQLSRYDVVNPVTDGSVHCFPGAVIGLTYHDHMTINSTKVPGGYSLSDFKHFLRQSYNLKIKTVSEIEKPVLVFISRSKSRKFVNEHEMVEMMEELGFEVIVARPNRTLNLNKFAKVVNSCKVMVGAHGAGLTNEVFLPNGAVMVQVVPLGLEWASATYYGDPADRLGLKYLEYKIEPEESSLLEKYGRDHLVIVDPKSMFLQGHRAARAVYIDGQDLKINVERFREILVEAMELIGGSTTLN